jgi:hypothetical protein
VTTRRAAVGLVVLSVFVVQVVAAIYGGLDVEPPDAWRVLGPLAVGMSLLAWFSSYSSEHRIVWIVDLAWFVLAAWALVIPYYVLKHEGRRGLVRIGLFTLTYLGAWATGLAVRIWILVLNSE